MDSAIPILLTLCFLLSISALVFLVWAVSHRQFEMGPEAARVIFSPGELDHGEPDINQELDASARNPVLLLYLSAVFWLIVGSVAGMLVSLKFHLPDLLVQQPWLTFGRVRPFHLNAVAYGWTSLAGLSVALWLMPRLLKTPLRGAAWASLGGILWNAGLAIGLTGILQGANEGQEWLELPLYADLMLVVAGAMIGLPLLLTLRHRQVHHLYVSTWYLGAALLWFPWLFLIANLPGWFTGVSQAVVNWWFAHNVLGLWVTPLGLAAAYYFIPKVLGKPIHSYQLSLLGFWSLALFYSQAGVHHLIGGPVPSWLVAVGIVHSLSMFVPVIAVAVNHHFTVRGHFRQVLHSPVLRFVVLGALLYTLVSLQGSLEALRSVNRVTHFTHYTVAHAHLGVYGFASFIFFGAAYFIFPRLLHRDWPWPWAVHGHWWLCAGGLAVYFLGLTLGGWLQGLALLNAKGVFLDSLRLTRPYLVSRSWGGGLMTLGHLLFAVHLLAMLKGGRR